MRIARKFSLESVGRRYESLSIEVEGDNPTEIMQRIDNVFKEYCEAIKNKVIN